MIEVKNFTKSFHNRLVIGDFSLFAQEGSLTALLGPSGCGKSTFFDLLMGNIPRDGGNLFLSGKEVADLKNIAAFMAQKDLLLPWLTLRENALLPVSVKKNPSSSDFREAEELFEILGLSGSADLYPRHVSGGMAQRCALARTILFRTPIVLLDEPFSAVDAITRQTLRSLLLLLRSRFRKTLLMITHDVEDALLLADSIIILSSTPMTAREKLVIPTPKERQQGDPSLQEKKERILAMLQENVS
ncbi:MAG: ABC transporter ATP-binding protein [Aminobacteriaceae bacterium]|nr:ABC transporter ATP-binding protein [Synergistaceae bacterium]